MSSRTTTSTQWRRMVGTGWALDWARDGGDWPNRELSRFLSVGGIRWHAQYSTPSDRPLILLIHGAGAASHSWRGVIPHLVATADVLAPDLPGHGFTSPAPSGRRTLPGFAAALAGLAESLGRVPDLIVGHSAGAAIALQIAQTAPVPPRAIVALNGALTPFRGLAGLLFPQMARILSINPLAPRLIARTGSDTATVARLIGMTGTDLDAEGLALYQRLVASPAHVSGTLDMMAGWQLDPLLAALPQIATRVVFLHGAKDGAVPVAETRRAARHLPDHRWIEDPTGGHLMHEADPARTAKLILDCLGERTIISGQTG